jgi:hypothetical protein
LSPPNGSDPTVHFDVSLRSELNSSSNARVRLLSGGRARQSLDARATVA